MYKMYIDKPEKEFRGANLIFGILLIKDVVERIAKIFNPFPISTSIQEMIDKLSSEDKEKLQKDFKMLYGFDPEE